MPSIPVASPGSCAKRVCRRLAVAVICALPPPLSEAASPAPDEPPLGRLFFTPDERQRLERQRAAPTRERESLPAGPLLRIQGIVSRGGGRSTLFIDDAMQDEEEPIHGIAVAPDRHAPGRLSIRVESSPTIQARVGDSVDRSNGEATPLLGAASIVQRETRPRPRP